jgi:hypothetical protein
MVYTKEESDNTKILISNQRQDNDDIGATLKINKSRKIVDSNYPKWFFIKIGIVLLVINLILLKLEISIQFFFIKNVPEDHAFYDSMVPIFKFLASISTIFSIIFISNIGLSISTLVLKCYRNYYYLKLLTILHLLSFIVTFIVGTIGNGLWIFMKYYHFKYIYVSFTINIITFIAMIVLTSFSSIISLLFFIKMNYFYIKELKVVSFRV